MTAAATLRLLLRRRPAPSPATTGGRPSGLVRCEVDGSPAGTESVREAIARCLESGAELDVIGVLGTTGCGTDDPLSERVRHVSDTQGALIRAARAARDAGIAVRVTSMCFRRA